MPCMSLVKHKRQHTSLVNQLFIEYVSHNCRHVRENEMLILKVYAWFMGWIVMRWWFFRKYNFKKIMFKLRKGKCQSKNLDQIWPSAQTNLLESRQQSHTRVCVYQWWPLILSLNLIIVVVVIFKICFIVLTGFFNRLIFLQTSHVGQNHLLQHHQEMYPSSHTYQQTILHLIR